jgi:hypothetical protein
MRISKNEKALNYFWTKPIERGKILTRLRNRLASLCEGSVFRAKPALRTGLEQGHVISNSSHSRIKWARFN